MKRKSKLKALTAAAVLAFSGAAVADVIPGNLSTAQNSELFFSVWSPSLGMSYTRDLGITVNNFFAGGATAPVDVAPGSGVDYAPGAVVNYAAGNVLAAGYKLVFGIDNVLTGSGLLAAADAVWNVVGIKSFGNPDRLFTTTNVANPTILTNAAVAAVGTTTTWLISTGGVNAAMPGSSGADNGSIVVTTPVLANANSTSFNANLGSNTPWATTGTVGGTLSFFEFDENGTNPNLATRTDYTGGFWQLAGDGTLSWNVAAVPVPGALVLMLSGLLGLVGVARRKPAVPSAA
jgi:hypothetical protein